MEKSDIQKKMLEEAAETGDIDKLYALLQKDGEFLEWYDMKAFIDTPLHVAASHGCTHFALEILRLKPWFGKKLNPHGLSPLHLALCNRHKDTVERLVKHEPQLIRVQGRECITPLHYVVESGDSDLLAEFLLACPTSVQDLTVRGETAVHVAVRNGRVAAFKVLLGWLQCTGKEGVLRRKDENGNTASHLAVINNQPEILKLLGKINLSEKNLAGRTAMDIAITRQGNNQVREILTCARAPIGQSVPTGKYGSMANFLSSKKKDIDQMLVGLDVFVKYGLSDDMGNAVLVAVVLIATSTFQAVLQPPGGLSQGGNNSCLTILQNGTNYINGTTIRTNGTTIGVDDNVVRQAGDGAGKVEMSRGAFYTFFTVNSIAFSASLGITAMLFPPANDVTLPLFFMWLSYWLAGYVISPPSPISSIVFFASYGVFFAIATMRYWSRMKLVSEHSPWIPSWWVAFVERRKLTRLVLISKYSS